MYMWLEGAIRGGVAQISRRYARANNKNVNPNFDPSRDVSSYLLFVDANALYSNAMAEPLPVSDYQWLTDQEIEALDLKSLDPHGDRLHFRL